VGEWAHWAFTTDADIGSWVIHPSRHRLGRCDRCGKRRFFLRLYDVWPRHMDHFGWVCADCLIEVLTVKADEGR
jgi:hypothetical protein